MINSIKTLCNILNNEFNLQSYVSNFNFTKFRKIIRICSRDIVCKFRDLFLEYVDDPRFYILTMIFTSKNDKRTIFEKISSFIDIDYKFINSLKNMYICSIINSEPKLKARIRRYARNVKKDKKGNYIRADLQINRWFISDDYSSGIILKHIRNDVSFFLDKLDDIRKSTFKLIFKKTTNYILKDFDDTVDYDDIKIVMPYDYTNFFNKVIPFDLSFKDYTTDICMDINYDPFPCFISSNKIKQPFIKFVKYVLYNKGFSSYEIENSSGLYRIGFLNSVKIFKEFQVSIIMFTKYKGIPIAVIPFMLDSKRTFVEIVDKDHPYLYCNKFTDDMSEHWDELAELVRSNSSSYSNNPVLSTVLNTNVSYRGVNYSYIDVAENFINSMFGLLYSEIINTHKDDTCIKEFYVYSSSLDNPKLRLNAQIFYTLDSSLIEPYLLTDPLKEAQTLGSIIISLNNECVDFSNIKIKFSRYNDIVERIYLAYQDKNENIREYLSIPESILTKIQDIVRSNLYSIICKGFSDTYNIFYRHILDTCYSYAKNRFSDNHRVYFTGDVKKFML